MSLFALSALILFSGKATFSADQLSRNVQLDIANSIASIPTIQGRGASNCQQNQSRCSAKVRELLKSDDVSAWGFGKMDSARKQCAGIISTDQVKSAFSTGRDLLDHISNFHFFGISELSRSHINLCLNDSDSFKMRLMSKYAYYSGRIKSSQAFAIEELTELDRVLGIPALNGVKCNVLLSETTIKRCLELKRNCKPMENELANLSYLTERAQNEIDLTEREMKTLEANINGPRFGSMTDRAERRNRYESLKLKVAMIKSHNPWLDGAVYQDARRRKKSTEESLKTQLLENKKQLEAQILRATEIHHCLSGNTHTRNCSAENIKNFVKHKTPPPIVAYDPKQGNTIQEAYAGYNFIRYENCALESSNDIEIANSLTMDFAYNSLLSIPPFAAARMPSIVKYLSSARSNTYSNLANLASKSSDTIYFAESLAHATAQCLKKDFQQFENQEFRSSSCTTKSKYFGRHALNKFDNCIQEILLNVPNALPLLGPISRSLNSTRAILDSNSKTLNQKQLLKRTDEIPAVLAERIAGEKVDIAISEIGGGQIATKHLLNATRQPKALGQVRLATSPYAREASDTRYGRTLQTHQNPYVNEERLNQQLTVEYNNLRSANGQRRIVAIANSVRTAKSNGNAWVGVRTGKGSSDPINLLVETNLKHSSVGDQKEAIGKISLATASLASSGSLPPTHSIADLLAREIKDPNVEIVSLNLNGKSISISTANKENLGALEHLESSAPTRGPPETGATSLRFASRKEATPNPDWDASTKKVFDINVKSGARGIVVELNEPLGIGVEATNLPFSSIFDYAAITNRADVATHLGITRNATRQSIVKKLQAKAVENYARVKVPNDVRKYSYYTYVTTESKPTVHMALAIETTATSNKMIIHSHSVKVNSQDAARSEAIDFLHRLLLETATAH